MNGYSTKTREGREVVVPFPVSEYAARLQATRQEMRRRGLSALIVFAQESHYYLTGYDTAGYVFFQAGIIPVDDAPTVLLTRRPDQRQAEVASLYDDLHIWFNREDANPALDLRDVLREMGLVGESVGVEFATYGLTGANGRLVESALNGVCRIEDGSDIVRQQRLVKSAAELECVRRAGELADAAVQAGLEATTPDGLEGDITAAALTAMLSKGGEMPSGGPLVNSGPRALFGRGIGGPRRLLEQDQVLIELAASFRRYHVCIEHTAVLGAPDPHQQDMMKVAAEALAQIKDAARAGTMLGRLDEIHRSVLDSAGFGDQRYAACGYALGCTFKPTWMDVPPMIYAGNPLVMAPGMVFFVHIMIPDTRSGLCAGLGQTFVISENGAPEVFSQFPEKLHIR